MKECPFCGHNKICIHDDSVCGETWWTAHCQSCSANVNEHTKQEAIDNWNNRSTNLFIEEYVTELEAILNSILDDATDDSTYKRLWPIRAENYRKAKKLLRNE